MEGVCEMIGTTKIYLNAEQDDQSFRHVRYWVVSFLYLFRPPEKILPRRGDNHHSPLFVGGVTLHKTRYSASLSRDHTQNNVRRPRREGGSSFCFPRRLCARACCCYSIVSSRLGRVAPPLLVPRC